MKFLESFTLFLELYKCVCILQDLAMNLWQLEFKLKTIDMRFKLGTRVICTPTHWV